MLRCWGVGLGVRFRVWGLRFRGLGLGFEGFGLWLLGFRVLGGMVEGLEFGPPA